MVQCENVRLFGNERIVGVRTRVLDSCEDQLWRAGADLKYMMVDTKTGVLVATS